jgi:hypothetical protein
MNWKWTKGEPYERSRRLKHVQELENKEFSKDMETSAYTSSLNHDENTWEILNQNAANSGFKVSNKREELDSKIAGRDMVQQIGFNPFLGQTNYAEDITIRDQYLKPINTTQGASRVSQSDYN